MGYTWRARWTFQQDLELFKDALCATLAKSLIINATDNQVLGIDFFFPDDKKKKPDFEAKK